MLKTASLVPLGLAAVLFAAPVSAQAVASASVQQDQAAFVLNLDGLTAANSAKVQARFAQVPTVTSVTVDAATGKVALTTGAGIQLDADAAKAAVQETGLTFKSLDIPAWAAETVWVVQVTGGSWSAQASARAAFQTAKQVAQFRQCGRVGTFTMSEKADLDKEAVKAAVEKKGLKIGSVEKVTRQKAQRELRYAFSKPSTWANTSDKVRAALLKIANVHEVYVTDEHLVVGIKTNGPVDEVAIRKILRSNNSASLFPVVVPEEPAA